jgi:hypothetical protein
MYTYRFFVASLWILLGISTSQAQFQGVLKMRHSLRDTASVTTSTIYMKNELMAMDMPAPGAGSGETQRVIWRGDKGVVWIIDDAQRSYLEAKTLPSGRNPQVRKSPAKRKAPQKTGSSQTIAGYSCDEWVASDDDTEYRFWASPKLGGLNKSLISSFSRMAEQSDGQTEYSIFEELGLFPMKLVESENGTVVATQEVTLLERKPVSADVFEVPHGYTKTSIDSDLQKMMEGMGQPDSNHELDPKQMEEMMKKLREHFGVPDSGAEKDSE